MPRSGLKCFVYVLLSLAALWLTPLTTVVAQETPTTEGKEFWLVFQKNFRDFVPDDSTDELKPSEPLTLGITISSRNAGSGYVESGDGKFRKEFSIEPGGAILIEVDTWFQLTSSGVVDNRAVHVVADVPISVYGTNHRYQTTDTYLGIPVEALGTRYRAVGYKWLAEDLVSQFAVLATEDDTKVQITPSARTKEGRPEGKPFTIVLNKGEVWQVLPRFNPATGSDLTGSLIRSNKPVAVYSGHNCAYVPERMWKACDMLVEQVSPTDTWDTEFVLGPLQGQNSSVYRVIADVDGTEISVNGEPVATIDAGAFYEEDNLQQSIVLTTNQPVMVMQYSKGFTAPSAYTKGADSVGDPTMIAIPPTSQYLSSYSFMTPFDGEWEHYINVVVKKRDAAKLRLDGKPIATGIFEPVPNSKYVYARVLIKEGPHTIQGAAPFGVYSYGFGYGDKIFHAYGNNCGQALARTVPGGRGDANNDIELSEESEVYEGEGPTDHIISRVIEIEREEKKVEAETKTELVKEDDLEPTKVKVLVESDAPQIEKRHVQLSQSKNAVTRSKPTPEKRTRIEFMPKEIGADSFIITTVWMDLPANEERETEQAEVLEAEPIIQDVPVTTKSQPGIKYKQK